MRSADKFKEYVNDISSQLKLARFTKSRNRYLLHGVENIGLIEIQKSKSSTSNIIRFTFNIGVYSKELSRFYGNLKNDITFEDCHWTQRIGFFLPENKDLWFDMSYNTDTNDLTGTTLKIILENVLPELETLIAKNGLLNLWLSNTKNNTTELERLLNLSVLLYNRNLPEAKNIEDELIDLAKRRKISIDLHLKKLHEEYTNKG